MKAHRHIAALVFALGCLTASCSSRHASFRHAAFPGLDTFDETQLATALNTPIVLPHSIRAAVLWLDQSNGWSAATLPESDRGRLASKLERELTAPPFASLSVIPTTLAEGGSGAVDLADVRNAAAHLQSEVAILVLTTSMTTVDWNFLALTYPALVTAFVVPGDDLRVDLGAQACAIDVRTGLFIACVQGDAEARDRFVVPAWRQPAVRSLAVRAAERALADLPQRLRAAVDARLGMARRVSNVVPAASAPPVVGVRYTTAD